MICVRWIQSLNKARTCYKWPICQAWSASGELKNKARTPCVRETHRIWLVLGRDKSSIRTKYIRSVGTQCVRHGQHQTKWHVLAISGQYIRHGHLQPNQPLEQSTYTFLLRKVLDMNTFSRYTKQDIHRVVGLQRTRYSQYTTSEISHMETYRLLA